MMGYSASGMFVNRFAAIHPEKVLGGIIGFPGSSIIIPPPLNKNERNIEGYPDWYQEYTYPVGVSDLQTLTGKTFNPTLFNRIHFHFFIGDSDHDDIFAYDQHYDNTFRAKLKLKFNKNNPRKRFQAARKAYIDAGQINSQFNVYPGVGHRFSPRAKQSVVEFIKSLTLKNYNGNAGVTQFTLDDTE